MKNIYDSNIPIKMDKFIKILAMLDAPEQGERASALYHANKMLESAGMRWRDLAHVFSPKSTTAPRGPFANDSCGADVGAASSDKVWKAKPEQEVEATKTAAFRERMTAERKAREKAERTAARRAAIAKYGSRAAATEVPEIQHRIVLACALLHDYSGPCHTLDGWSCWGDRIPESVALALEEAVPWPSSIAAAKVEMDMWNERDQVMAAFATSRDRQECAETWLPMACHCRLQIVTDLLHYGLRAVSLEDAIVRQRAIRDSENVPTSEETDAMLADMEHLAAAQTKA